MYRLDHPVYKCIIYFFESIPVCMYFFIYLKVYGWEYIELKALTSVDWVHTGTR